MSLLKNDPQKVGSLQKKALNRIAKKAAPHLAGLRPGFAARQLQHPIFVVGCGRSGTTLLGRLLDMHLDVANWTEANEIWDPQWYPWREENIDKPPMEYDPDGFTARWWQENASRMSEIKAIFGAYQYLRGKPFFMNKTPYHVFRMPYLVEYFPEARYVYIMRDGRAVVNSYVKKLYRENAIREWPEQERNLFRQSEAALAEWLGKFWRQTVEEMEKQNEALGLEAKGLMYSTTYEALCADTPGVLREMCDVVGLDFDRFITGVVDQTTENTNHKWRKGLEDESIERMVAAMEPKLSEYGYV